MLRCAQNVGPVGHFCRMPLPLPLHRALFRRLRRGVFPLSERVSTRRRTTTCGKTCAGAVRVCSAQRSPPQPAPVRARAAFGRGRGRAFFRSACPEELTGRAQGAASRVARSLAEPGTLKPNEPSALFLLRRPRPLLPSRPDARASVVDRAFSLCRFCSVQRQGMGTVRWYNGRRKSLPQTATRHSRLQSIWKFKMVQLEAWSCDTRRIYRCP